MDNYDYEAINSLANSKGWELLCKELDIRIKSIETIFNRKDINFTVIFFIWTNNQDNMVNKI